ncbi:MAG: ORF6N domain-containing protein, partial [Eubacterium sp.]|nr:ORF6N domain-containing protein [Eubacterium sp.]
LTKEEVELVKSQIATSPDSNFYSGQEGGRRKPPYAFTEQGIYMLATVLKGEIADQQSIFIMRAFREMRHFIANNALLFEKVSHIELKQLEYQKSTDERFDKVFQYIEDHAEAEQKVFFDGQIYDAFSLITSIIQKAQNEIILIDGYVDVDTLNILAKKNAGVDVKIFTYASARLTNTDAANFNAQYPTLTVTKTQVFHDRFIILDGKLAYHIGASIKDAGKKCFGISLLEDPGMVTDLLNRLRTI